jgi:hypothetical protein
VRLGHRSIVGVVITNVDRAILDPAGLLISSILDGSSDPENDIATKLWIVDGQQRAYDYVIPTGSHTLILEVEDERGAFDIDEQVVTIIYP